MIILHHLGLGDHIICNGMVRHFYERNNDMQLCVAFSNARNVEHMYRDLPSLQLIQINKPTDADYLGTDVMRIGFDKLPKYFGQMSFDRAFYDIAKLDFNIRFDKFGFERDYDREQQLIKELNPEGEPFIFIHDAPDKGFNIRTPDTKYKIIRNDLRFLIFDYIGLIEAAEEVHFMQSSFKELICSYRLLKPRLYQHNYVRQYNQWLNSSGLNSFEEIN
jgi:hypothetical protein